jgi:hypothetical protein
MFRLDCMPIWKVLPSPLVPSRGAVQFAVGMPSLINEITAPVNHFENELLAYD